jgi:hypothetical protein
MGRTCSNSRRWCVALLGVLLGLAGSASAFGADEPTPPDMSVTIPATTVVRGAPGTVHVLATKDVPADLVGQQCSVTGVGANNESVHPETDLIVASGGSQVVVPDVEATPGGSTTASGTVTLGTTVTLSVQLGPDGAFSGGGSVNFVCTPSVTPGPLVQPGPQVGGVTATAPAAPQAAPAAPSASPSAAPRAVRAAPSFTG